MTSMDQYGNQGNGAVSDPGAEYGGTYPAQPESQAPQQQQMFPQQDGQQQQINPRQQQIDPELFNQAVDALHQWERYGQEQEQLKAAQKASDALKAEEQRLLQQYQEKRAEAWRIKDDDPERALRLVDEAAGIERQARLNREQGIIAAAGRALQMQQQQAEVPRQIQQMTQQYQLSGDAAEILRQLTPEQIPGMARYLGMTEQKVREAQQRQRQNDRQQMQQSGAHVAPALSGAPSQQAPAPGSREQLRQALMNDPDFAHLYAGSG